MGIGPVPNLLPVRVLNLPEAAAPQTERARAIEFRGQQQGQNSNQDQDATYTPGGNPGNNQDESAHRDSDSAEFKAAAGAEDNPAAQELPQPDANPSDDPDAGSTISLFA